MTSRTCVGRRALQLRGKDVTLRTYTLGGKDADYRVEPEVPATVMVRALQSEPRRDVRSSDESGEEFVQAMEFRVADGDEPAITPGLPNPEIDDVDGVTWEVRTVGPEKGGLRRILCRRAR